jgi:preprotein translocase subunit SecE
VARQTRAQRRARRAERAGAIGDGAVAQPAPQAPVRQPPRPVAPEAPRPATEEKLFPGTQFVRESWAELKKVDWPTQSQVIQATVVVLIACAIVGFYLWGVDLLFRRLVEHVFLR